MTGTSRGQVNSHMTNQRAGGGRSAASTRNTGRGSQRFTCPRDQSPNLPLAKQPQSRHRGRCVSRASGTWGTVGTAGFTAAPGVALFPATRGARTASFPSVAWTNSVKQDSVGQCPAFTDFIMLPRIAPHQESERGLTSVRQRQYLGAFTVLSTSWVSHPIDSVMK